MTRVSRCKDTVLTQKTKKCLRTLSSFILICTATVSLANQSSEFQQNVNAIARDDITVIKRVGNSGNRAYIPYLRQVIVHRGTILPYTQDEDEAFVSLLTLRSRDDITYLECELQANERDSARYFGDKILPKVKGWLAIRAYYHMLGPDEDIVFIPRGKPV